MSDIDKRVVQMEFDNSKFDKNVKKSSNTLSKFEKQLKFEDVSDSLNVVKKGFSALEIAGITAVSRITNAVINLGVKLTKSLSVDQITSGWQKFGDKTIAVATLAAQKIVVAGKELSVYEEKMEGITEQLEKLEWFTNETSYTFNDMVAALGKFTAAGQDLDKSVNAMEGIATWAAMSGANAQKASSAMTQLAQTLGRGYVLRIDWQSIQTLNMDTAMFREKVLDTAVELGKLKKVGNDFISNTGKKITAVNFTETLSSKWFTSDVLVKTLEKYSAAVEDIYQISEREGISARAVIEKYGDTLDEFAVKAFKAAQETRTLGEALTYVFSTIGSTWSQTFEKIIGGYDEAKTLWSDLSDALYEDVIASNDFRNEVLGAWEEMEGRADLFAHGGSKQGVFWNIYDSIIAVKNVFKNAKEAVFPSSSFDSEADQAKELGSRFKEFTERLRENTAQILENIKNDTKFTNVLKGMYTIIKFIIVTMAGIWNVVSPIVDVLKDLISNVFSRLSIIGNKISKMDGVIESITETSEELRSVVETIIDIINPEKILNGIFGFIRDIFNIIKDIKPFESLKDIIKNFFETLEKSGGTAENFKRIINGILSIVSMLAKIIKQVLTLISKYVVPVAVKLLDVISQILAVITGIITEALAVVADFFTALNSLLEGNTSKLSGFGDVVIDFLKSIPSKIKLLEPILRSILDIIKSLIDILLLIPKALNNVSKSLTGRGIIENIAYIFDSISELLKGFVATLKGQSPKDLTYLFQPIITLFEGLVEVIKGIIAIARPLITIIGIALKYIGQAMQALGDFLTDLVNGTAELKVNGGILKAIGIIALVAGIITLIALLIARVVYAIQSTLFPIAYSLNNVTDSLYNLSLGYKIRAISFAIESIGLSLLTLAASILLIGYADPDALKRGILVISAFTILFGAFALVAVILNKSVGKLEKTFNSVGIRKSVTSVVTSMDSVTDFIRQLAKSMLKLAIAMAVISWIDEGDMWRSFGVIAIFTSMIMVFAALMTALDFVISLTNKKGERADSSLQYLGHITDNLGKTIFKFALSILVLSWIDVNGIWKAFGAIAAFVGLIVAAYLLIQSINVAASKITKESVKLKGSGNAIQGIANLIKNIGKTLLKFALTVAILSLIPVDDMWDAMGALSLYMALIAGMIIAINLTAGKTKKAGGSIDSVADLIKRISKSLLILMLALVILPTMLANGAFDSSSMWQVFGIIASMLAILTAMILAINLTAGKYKGAEKSIGKLGLVIGMLSLFMLSFGGAMLIIMKVPVANMITGIVGLSVLFGLIAVIFAVIGKMAKGLSKDKLEQVKKILISTLIPLSIVLLAFGGSMLMIKNVPWANILISVAAIAALLGGIWLLTKFGASGFSKISGTFALLLALCPVLLAFGLSMKLISDVPWLNILVAVGMLAVLLATLAITSKFADPKNMALIALSLLLLAPAILIFAAALRAMQNLGDLGKIALQLVIIAAAMAVFGVIGTFVGGGLIMFSMGALLLSTSLLVLALALELLSTSFVELCIQISENADSVKNAMIVLATSILETLKAIILGLLQLITDSLVAITQAIVTIILAVCTAIIETAPAIFEAITVVITNLLTMLIDIMPQFFNWLTTLVTGLLQMLTKVMPDFLKWLKQLINGLLQLLINCIPQFLELVKVLLEGILQLIIDVIPNLLDTLLIVIQETLEFLKNLTVTLATEILNTIIGIIDVLIKKVPQIVSKLVDLVTTTITAFLTHIPTFVASIGAGLTRLMYQLADIINQQLPLFIDAGMNIMKGIAKGIGKLLTSPIEFIKAIGEGMIDGFCDIFDINSPSKVMAKLGGYIVEGLSKGIDEEAGDVTDSMNNVISKVSDAMSEDLNTEDLTIKPVVDLSNVHEGVANIQELMSGISGGTTVSVSEDMAASTSRLIDRKNSESVAGSGNQNVVNNEGDNYYNTWNITTNDPEEFAREADKIFQKLRVRANLAKGGAR